MHRRDAPAAHRREAQRALADEKFDAVGKDDSTASFSSTSSSSASTPASTMSSTCSKPSGPP
jgi:hypothetical protein